MRTLGYAPDEIETIWKLLAAILHLVSWGGREGEREGRKRE